MGLVHLPNSRLTMALCGVLLLAGGVGLDGCKRPNDDAERWVSTKDTLRQVCISVILAKHHTDQFPPIAFPELLSWIEAHGGEVDLLINDKKGRTIRDGWGNVIRTVTQDGKLVGLGSAGANGVWEDGAGDDIVVTLRQLEEEEKARR